MANTNVSPQQYQINAQVCFGLSEFANTVLLNFIEPSSNTATFQIAKPIPIPPGTNFTVNLANEFLAANQAVSIGWYDGSNPGQQVNWGLTASGPRFNQSPGGFTLLRLNQAISGLPLLYFDNPSINVNAIIWFFCIAN